MFQHHPALLLSLAHPTTMCRKGEAASLEVCTTWCIFSLEKMQQGNSEAWDLIVETAVRVTKRSRNSEVGRMDGERWCRNVTFFRRNACYSLCFQLIRRSCNWLQVPRTPRIHFWCIFLIGILSRGKSVKCEVWLKWEKGRNWSLTLQTIMFLSRNGKYHIWWQFDLDVQYCAKVLVQITL